MTPVFWVYWPSSEFDEESAERGRLHGGEFPGRCIQHDFVGVDPGRPSESNGGEGDGDVVARTLRAREERRLAENLVVVGMGAQYQEWFCLDVSKPLPNGEYPVLMFDARDNALDQQFYDDFGQMLEEVMGFVADSLDQPLD